MIQELKYDMFSMQIFFSLILLQTFKISQMTTHFEDNLMHKDLSYSECTVA